MTEDGLPPSGASVSCAAAEAYVARLDADFASAGRIADVLTEGLDPDDCAVSTFETDTGWAVEVVFRRPEDKARILRLFARDCGGDPAVTFEAIERRDWVASSLAGLAPVQAGQFIVHGAHDRGRIPAHRIGIEIEAALAFGTGHHGTTRGCLLALERICKRSAPRRVLDIGTGSGVLAIAAARRLRQPVLASDIDPVAVRIARANARINRAATLVTVIAASGTRSGRFRAGARYDLIFANILEGPLRRMSRDISVLLAPGGRFVLSGLLPAQAAGVIAAYRRQGLALCARTTLDNWVTLILRRGR